MISRGLFACLSLVACGTPAAFQKTEPIPTVTATAPSATNDAGTTPEACLPNTTAKAGLVELTLSGDHALACYGDTCGEVDLRSGKLVRTEKWDHVDASVAAPPPPSFTTTTDSVTVCNPKDAKAPCTTIKVRPSLDAGHGGSEKKEVIAALSDDRARLFVFAPEVAPGADRKFTTSWTTYGDTYDVSTRKRVFHQRLTTPQNPIFSDYSNMWSASWVDNYLLLGDYVCCGPGGTSMLFDPEHGGTVKRVHGYGGSFARLSVSTYAVIEQKTLAFVDAATLQDIGRLITAPGKPLDSFEGASALVRATSDVIVFAYANPPGVIIFDPIPVTFALPLCP